MDQATGGEMKTLQDVYSKTDELQDAVLRQNEIMAETLDLINKIQMGLEEMINELREANND